MNPNTVCVLCVLKTPLKLLTEMTAVTTVIICFCVFAEMGANRATDPTAGPLPGHFSLHSGVKGQDGALQYKRAQTGKKKIVSVSSFEIIF